MGAERYQLGSEGYGHLGIERRTYFRWTGYGKQAVPGPDFPPFDDCAHLEAWYDRMRSQGFFKHKFPNKVKQAVAAHLGQTASTASAPKAKRAASLAPSGTPDESPGEEQASLQSFEPGSARGLLVEVEQMERRVAQLRMARDDAENRGHPNARQLDLDYNAAVASLSTLQGRATKLAIAEKVYVHIDDIASALAPKFIAIVHTVPFMFDGIDHELHAEPDRQKRRARFRAAWIEACRSLVTGSFAPPLKLEELV